MSLRPNALLWVLLTGLLGILGQWDPAVARWWCLPAALLLAALAWEATATRRCSLGLDIHGLDPWLLGRTQAVKYTFTQDKDARVTIQAVIAPPEGFAATARLETLDLTHSPGTVILDVMAKRLGRYAWPTPEMRISGFFGLAWWPRRLTTSCTVTVIPDVMGRTTAVANDQAGGTQPAFTGGEGKDILQLRDYRHGDPLRLIDWKASARRGNLISREHSEARHLEVLIAIDAGRSSGLSAGDIDRLGLYVNIAARLAQRAAQLDDAVGVLVFASQPLAMLPPARGDTAVTRIRRVLASCQVQSGSSNPALAAARIRASIRRRTLVVLLTDLEDSPLEQLVQAVRLLRPKHYAVIAGLENPRILALPLARSDDPLAPYRALAATEYRRSLSNQTQALRALGAAALTARPDCLDRAVLQAYRDIRLHRRV